MKKMVSITSTLLAMFLLASCAPPGANRNQHGKEDPTKTHLYVYTYNGGVGRAWLDNLATKFMEDYAGESFAEGKTGIEVHVEADKATDVTANSPYDVVFVEGVRIFSDIAAGNFLPINDLVTESLADVTNNEETATIESKLSVERQKMLKAVDGNYYCLPHYETYDGIVYDQDLFEEYGFYFLEGGGFCDMDSFENGVYVGEGRLSVGPDGVRGTSDDGLASSYEEMFSLIDYMVKNNVTPFMWTGAYISSYAYRLLNGAWAAMQGKEQMELNFNFDSNATGKEVLTEIIESFDEDGNPETKMVSVTPETAYQLSAQTGKYYALKLLEKILSNSANYSTKITGVLTHLEAQEEYIFSSLENNPCAMLIEGSWWYNEASDAFKRSINKYKDEAKNRRFAMMELPRQATGQVTEGNGTKNTLYSALEAYGFINAKIEGDQEAVKAAKTFLKYAYTQESLEQFTVDTGVFRGVDYSVSNEKLVGLDNYKKSIIALREKSDVVAPIGYSAMFVDNQVGFLPEFGSEVYKSIIGGATKNDPFAALKNSETTAKGYFSGSIKDASYWKKYSKYFD